MNGHVIAVKPERPVGGGIFYRWTCACGRFGGLQAHPNRASTSGQAHAEQAMPYTAPPEPEPT